ncbi:uncharacterized protein LOC129914841 [Episyrphus balteatus]|uniref:uncharacterized protein LOC129914841 n=1 Tax=Episyrphus balteatus TaxID=286459 RepID=UPI00248612BB|nr:uncharacterized protein LOC129914841 [Episyrphus balteatus]
MIKCSVLFSKFAFILLVIASSCYSQYVLRKRCNTAYRCSDEEKPVWATTTGHDCLVYRNACHLLSANCDRINRDEPEALLTDREVCQRFCATECPPFFVPICAFHNEGKMQTFGNQCEMEKHICKTGLTFSIFRAEKCPDDLEFKE